MAREWIEIKIAADPALLDTVSSYLFANGAEGIEEREDYLVVYFAQNKWNTEKASLVKDYLTTGLAISSEVIDWGTIPDSDWNENWKVNFKTFQLSNTISISPDWEQVDQKKGEINLRISPKMAFGTGHHETTQLLLILLDKYVQNGDTLLDAGCGSGILAIFAALKGAGSVVAFDNDSVAMLNVEENLMLNKVDAEIEICTGQLDDLLPQPFDLIVANINRNVLLDLAGQFQNYITPDGKLMLSGLLKEDEQQIRSAYRKKDWRVIERQQKNEWIALVLTRNNNG